MMKLFSKLVIFVSIISFVNGYTIYEIAYTDSLSAYFGRLKHPVDPADKPIEFTAIESDCVEEKLNFTENGKKIVKLEQAKEIFNVASSICLKNAAEQKLQEDLQDMRQLYSDVHKASKCLKQKLSKFDPNSFMLENWKPKRLENCDYELIDEALNSLKGSDVIEESQRQIDEKCENIETKKILVLESNVLATETDGSNKEENKQKIGVLLILTFFALLAIGVGLLAIYSKVTGYKRFFQ